MSEPLPEPTNLGNVDLPEEFFRKDELLPVDAERFEFLVKSCANIEQNTTDIVSVRAVKTCALGIMRLMGKERKAQEEAHDALQDAMNKQSLRLSELEQTAAIVAIQRSVIDIVISTAREVGTLPAATNRDESAPKDTQQHISADDADTDPIAELRAQTDALNVKALAYAKRQRELHADLQDACDRADESHRKFLEKEENTLVHEALRCLTEAIYMKYREIDSVDDRVKDRAGSFGDLMYKLDEHPARKAALDTAIAQLDISSSDFDVLVAERQRHRIISFCTPDKTAAAVLEELAGREVAANNAAAKGLVLKYQQVLLNAPPYYDDYCGYDSC